MDCQPSRETICSPVKFQSSQGEENHLEVKQNTCTSSTAKSLADASNLLTVMSEESSPSKSKPDKCISSSPSHTVALEEPLIKKRKHEEKDEKKATESNDAPSDERPSSPNHHILHDDPAVQCNVPNAEEKQIIFKKPMLALKLGQTRGKLSGKIHTELNAESVPSSGLIVRSLSETSSAETGDAVGNKPDSVNLAQGNLTSIPYKEPSWAGYPSRVYGFEIIKGGKIIEQFDLSTRSSHCIGRLPACHIVLLHPTISRFHAIIQYRDDEKGTPDEPPGLYVYDLGSTHGTFLNKSRIKERMYVRIHVGYVIKFGCSTRQFLVKGPQEDQEEESVLTVTQIQTQRNNELIRRKLEKLKGKVPEEDQGISWGMDDDADEETDLTINPFASSNNEELYIDDPKKTLRGWFEREGHELVYNVEEKASGQFLCQIELPVDSAPNGIHVAEALVKGKKKEAVLQCALEACRALDRYALLRQATHESKKRKAKDWEADDFYDSDDDTFLDRTGTVEKKRKARMEANAEPAALTYTDLMKKHEAIMIDLQEYEARMAEVGSKRLSVLPEKKEALDELDAYMHTINNCPQEYDKTLASRLKVQITDLKKEASRVRHMINLVRPPGTPEMTDRVPEEAVSRENVMTRMAAICRKTKMLRQKKADSGIPVSRKTMDPIEKVGKYSERESTSPDHARVLLGNEMDDVTKLEASDEDGNEDEGEAIKTGTINETCNEPGVEYINDNWTKITDHHDLDNEIQGTSTKEKINETSSLNDLHEMGTEDKHVANLAKEKDKMGPATSVVKNIQESVAKLTNSDNVRNLIKDEVLADKTGDVGSDDDDCDKGEVDKEEAKRKKRNKKRILQRNVKSRKERHARWTGSDNPSELFSDWTPPQGQSGDGRTSLNDKLGY